MKSYQILIACLVAIAAEVVGDIQAQQFPNKPIRIIIPFVADSTTDVLGRVVGQKLSERAGQQIIIEPKPGGNGILATKPSCFAMSTFPRSMEV